MPNVLGNLLKGFDQSYGRASQDYEQEQRSNQVLAREEALQKYKDLQKQREDESQNDLIKQIVTGKSTQTKVTPKSINLERNTQPLSLRNGNLYQSITTPEKTEQVETPLSAEDKTNALLGLNKASREKLDYIQSAAEKENAYNTLNNLPELSKDDINNLPPEIKRKALETINFGKMTGETPQKIYDSIQNLMTPKKVNNLPYEKVYEYEGGVIRREKTDGLNPDYKLRYNEADIPGGIHKDRTGRFVQDVGFYDPYANVWGKTHKGQYQISESKPIKVTTTGTNGEKLFSKEITQHFNDYKKQMASLLGQIHSPDTDEADKNILKSKLGEISSNFSQEIKNTAPDSFVNWYKQLWQSGGGNKKINTNPDKATYWNELMKAYQSGDLSPRALTAGYNLYISTYLENPLQNNKINGNFLIEDNTQDENQNDNEE